MRAEINGDLNYRKDQWNKDLVLWKDKQDWEIFNQTPQERKQILLTLEMKEK